MIISLDTGLIAGVIGALLFGVLYNLGVQRLSQAGHTEGFTAYLVVAGVAVTLAFSLTALPLTDVLIVLLFFAAAGLPMVVGSTWAYMQRRARGRELIRSLDQPPEDAHGD